MEEGFFISEAFTSKNDNVKTKNSKSSLTQQNFTFKDKPDFTAFVPIENSSSLGYLCINHELTNGGMSILDVFLGSDELWSYTLATEVDFSGVAGTSRNCSGAITPWNTVLSCEESTSSSDVDSNGYHDIGWAVEIDPTTKTVIDKRWAMGKFKHENAIVHHNQRTVYQGIDDSQGYLYKFVASTSQDLSNGLLYVYKGSKNGAGNWLLVPNSTQTERNNTISASAGLNATLFDGIEDVDIGHDGLVYFAVKNESAIYRFQDSHPISGTTVPSMEEFVGPNTFSGGLPGIDNLAFDCDGNLWAMQDGGNDHIWVIKKGSSEPLIFGRTPKGSEPTGLTFTPDCRYGFMSIQHPSSSNSTTVQIDAAGRGVAFDKDVSLVFARIEDLGQAEDSCLTGVIDLQIEASMDDVEESNDGTIYGNSSDLELVDDDGSDAVNGPNQKVGLRFNDVALPKGAKIKRAFIQFNVDETDSSPGTIFIQAEALDHAPALAGSQFELSNKTLTSSCVEWKNLPIWNTIGLASNDQKTPDLSIVIEEITDRPGWSANNSMLFVLSGSGQRVAESFDGASHRAPVLHIEYEYCSYDAGCDWYGNKTLSGPLPTNFTRVEEKLLILGNTSSPNQYHFESSRSIDVKPGSSFPIGSEVTFDIKECRNVEQEE